MGSHDMTYYSEETYIMQLTNAQDNGGERGQGMSKQAHVPYTVHTYTVERLLLKQIVH